MATLRKQSRGDSWQLRVILRGERVTLSLPDLTEWQANKWKEYVQSIATSIDFDRPLDKKTIEWISTLSREQRKKLSDKGLIDPDPGQADLKKDPKEVLLKDYLEEYFSARKSDVKKATWIFYQHTRKRLVEFFKDSTVRSITPKDGRDFRKWLESTNKRNKPTEDGESKGLAINTVKRRTGLCRQIFAQAIKDGILDRNPFEGLSTAVRANEERKVYVDLGDFAKVLAKAPNARWRSLLVLARIAAFRIPSEAQGLKWEHISFEQKRLFVVNSSKTEHHKNRNLRVVPLFPEVEKELLKLHCEATPGEEYVFPDLRADSNLRTTLEKIILRAGVTPWPKLWQNLRSSAATDLARSVPSHIAASICGHTEEVAKEHYWKVGEGDLDQTMEKLSKVHSEKLAHKLALSDVSEGLVMSPSVSKTCDDETKKPKESLGFVAICRLLADAGYSIRMGEEGSESPPKSQGNRRESPNLAHKLALFDVSTLWGSLDDEDKIATLLFWESLQRGRVGQ
jgi:integrase